LAGKFILSLDCEGLWGIADILTPRHRHDLTDERLHDAYRSILDVLDEFQLPATFAFVGAFAQSPTEFERLRAGFKSLGGPAQAYLAPALNEIDKGDVSGWHGHELVEMVAGARAGHEIALHGVTHVPWTMLDTASAEAEMRLFDDLEGPVRESRTFVYPRNLIDHVELLSKHGFVGFRTALAARSRAASLLSEFNLFETPQRPEPHGDIVHIPAAFFLNWRNGLRRLVPAEVTRLRARRLLDAAARNGGIVHYWLHPENVASAPSTLRLLEALAREVALARDAGGCEVLTQLGYCRPAESLQ
jgi:peptidoglycan/xylan/chitin deacetylase (PgdA/CDA1 family)